MEHYVTDAKGNRYRFGKLTGFEIRHKDKCVNYIVTIQCYDADADVITVPLWYALWSIEDLTAELVEAMKKELDCIYMFSAKDEVNYLIVPEQALVLGGKQK